MEPITSQSFSLSLTCGLHPSSPTSFLLSFPPFSMAASSQLFPYIVAPSVSPLLPRWHVADRTRFALVWCPYVPSTPLLAIHPMLLLGQAKALTRRSKSGCSPPPPPDSAHPQPPHLLVHVPAPFPTHSDCSLPRINRTSAIKSIKSSSVGSSLSSTSGLPRHPPTSKTDLGEQLEHFHPLPCSSRRHRCRERHDPPAATHTGRPCPVMPILL